MAAQYLTFRNTAFDVVDINGQPWIPAYQLSKALGYQTMKAVTNIYRRNADEFTESMSSVVKLTTKGKYLRLNQIFSLRGAHLIAMFAGTPIAKEFRKWVLDILDRETAVPPAPTFETVRQRLMLVIENGQITHSRPIGIDECILDTTSEGALFTLINESIPRELLPMVMKTAGDRMILNHNPTMKRIGR